jgi:hypothetical protein
MMSFYDHRFFRTVLLQVPVPVVQPEQVLGSSTRITTTIYYILVLSEV